MSQEAFRQAFFRWSVVKEYFFGKYFSARQEQKVLGHRCLRPGTASGRYNLPPAGGRHRPLQAFLWFSAFDLEGKAVSSPARTASEELPGSFPGTGGQDQDISRLVHFAGRPSGQPGALQQLRGIGLLDKGESLDQCSGIPLRQNKQSRWPERPCLSTKTRIQGFLIFCDPTETFLKKTDSLLTDKYLS